MTERWASVPGYEMLYAVSDSGRIKSVRNGVVMANVLDRDGYHTIKLSKAGKGIRHKVHRLVCQVFNGEPPAGLDCAHLDGDKANNTPQNLAWVTRAENLAHRRLHGTDQTGERGAAAKLTWSQVREIRRRAALGEPRQRLADEFGLALGHVRRIILHEAWRSDLPTLSRNPPGEQ
jgi:hypothetical protein